MKREQLQEILLLYRSGNLDRNDEFLAEALQAAEQDPELKAWLDHHLEAQEQIRTSLRSIPAPEHLKQRLLQKQKITPFYQRRQFLIGAAAALAALGTAGAILQPTKTPRMDWRHFEERMLSYAVRSYGMDIVSSDEREVRNYLALKGAPAQFPLPGRLPQLPVKGGAKLLWNNRPVAMICFQHMNETAYLFVLEETSSLQTKNLQAARIGRFYLLSKATWVQDGRLYLLGLNASPEEVNALISS